MKLILIRRFSAMLLLTFGLAQGLPAQVPLGTEFTFQGELRRAGLPADGSFDFEFNLFDDPDPFLGALLGSESLSSVAVDSGLFTVTLDFGDVVLGDALWLEVRVRPSGGGALVALFPLQPLTAAPYALFSRRASVASVAGDADTLDGLEAADFVTAELDPTVRADVKDGVSWDELADVPSGFADGVDDVGAGVPTGTIVAFAGATPPAGWLLCDGSEVSRTTFAELFAVLAGTWGIGDGLTTFNLPDLRGRSAVGSGGGPGLSERLVGELGGAESHQLSIDEMPAHNHTMGFTRGDQNGGQGVRFLGGAGGPSTSTTGGDQPHNNMSPFTVVHFIIKT